MLLHMKMGKAIRKMQIKYCKWNMNLGTVFKFSLKGMLSVVASGLD